MSTVIDQKVVEMKFDNRDFEKNVSESMSTLDKLKEKLKFKESASGLEDLEKAASKVHMSGLTSAIDTVSMKFSAMEVVAISVLNRITNEAITAGEQLIKSFTVDQISAGWQKFADKTTSVATLISQGYDQDTVNEQLERLNWFTDETSYNFTEMVSNIGKFTASGQDLESSVTAMEGIATWAALSGQNAATASRAMYQLAQAMGSGVMRLQDYRSIQNANMDTKEFRQNALDAAVAIGTLREVSEGYYESMVDTSQLDGPFTINQFADSLSKGKWFNADVMMRTFNMYSSAVNDLYDYSTEMDITASQAIEQLGDTLDEFGLKAFKAAQEAKTWTDVVDSVKDAVSTGWMNTFEIIFGDYSRSKVLWTDLANYLYEVFATPVNNRNDVLTEAFASKFDLLQSTVANAGITVDDLKAKVYEMARESGINVDEMISLGASFGDIIRDDRFDVKALQDAIRGMGKDSEIVTGKMTRSMEEYEELVMKMIHGEFGNGRSIRAKAFEELGLENYELVQEMVNDYIYDGEIHWEKYADAMSVATGASEDQIAALNGLADAFDDADGELLDLLADIDKPSGRELLIQSLWNTLHALVGDTESGELSGGLLGIVRDAWAEVFPPATADNIYSILEAIEKFTRNLKLNENQSSKLNKVLTGFFKLLKNIRDAIVKLWNATKPFRQLIGQVIDIMIEATAAFFNFLDGINERYGVIDKFASVIEGAGTAVKTFVDKSGGVDKILSYIQEFGENGSSVFSNLARFLNENAAGWNELGSIFGGAGFATNAKSKLWEIIPNLGNAVIDWDYTVVTDPLEKIGSSFTSMVGTIVGVSNTDEVKQAASNTDTVTEAISNMASTINSTETTTATDNMGEFDRMLGEFANVLTGATSAGIAEKASEVSSAMGSVSESGEELGESAAALDAGAKLLGQAAATLSPNSEAAAAAIEVLTGGTEELKIAGTSEVIEDVSESIEVLNETLDKTESNGVTQTMHSVSELFTDIADTSSQKQGIITRAFSAISGAFKSFFSHFDGRNVLILSYMAAMVWSMMSLSTALAWVWDILDKKAITGIGAFLKGVGKGISSIGASVKNKSIGTMVKDFAWSLLILAGAMYLLASIPVDRLFVAGAVIIGLMFTLKFVISGMMALAAKMGAVKTIGEALNPVRNGYMQMLFVVASIGATLLLLTFAFRNIVTLVQELTLEQGSMWKAIEVMAVGIGMLIVIMATLTGSLVALGKFAPSIGVSGAAIIGLSLGVILLTQALKILMNMDPDKIASGLVRLVIVLGALAGATRLLFGFRASAGLGIVGFVLAINFLIISIRVLAELDLFSVLPQIVLIIMIMTAITMILAIAGRIVGKESSIMRLGVTLLAFSAAMLILTGAMLLMQRLEPGAAVKAAFGMAILTACIAAIIAFSKTAHPKAAGKAASVIVSFAMAILVLAGSMLLISKLEWHEIRKAMAVFAGIAAIFAAILWTSQFADGALGPLIVITVAIMAIGTLIAILMAMDDAKSALLNALAIDMLLGGMAAVVLALAKFTSTTKGMTKESMVSTVAMFAFLAIIVAMIAGVMKWINATDPANNILNSIALSVLLSVMTRCLLTLIKGTQTVSVTKAKTKNFITGLAALMGVVAVLAVLYAIIQASKLRAVDWGLLSQLAVGLIFLSALYTAFAFLAKNKITLTQANADKMLMGMTFLMGIVLEMAAVFGLIHKMHIQAMDWTLLAQLAAGIIVMTGLFAAFSLISTLPMSMSTIVSTVFDFAAFITALSSFFVVLGGIRELFNTYLHWDIVNLIKEGGDILIAIAEVLGGVIGAFFGSIIGYVAVGISSGFNAAADNISVFLDKIDELVIKIKGSSYDDELIPKLTGLLSMVELLGDVGFKIKWEAIASLGGGMGTIKTHLAKFGEAVAEFAKNIKTMVNDGTYQYLDNAHFSGFITAANQIATLSEKLTRIAELEWDANDTESLIQFSKSIVEFASSAKSLKVNDLVNINTFGVAVKSLFSIIDSTPESLLDSGKNNLFDFDKDSLKNMSANLGYFITAMNDITDQVADFDTMMYKTYTGSKLAQSFPDSLEIGTKSEVLLRGIEILNAVCFGDNDNGLFNLIAHMPKNDSMSKFTGINDTTMFGDNLSALGHGVLSFCTDMAKLMDENPNIKEAISKTFDLVSGEDGLFSIVDALPPFDESFAEKVFGVTSLEIVSDKDGGLADLGKAIVNFANEVKDLTATGVTHANYASQAIQAIMPAVSSIALSGVSWESTFTGIEGLGKFLTIIGPAYKEFYESVQGTSSYAMTNAATILRSLADTYVVLNSVSSDPSAAFNFDSYVNAFEKLGSTEFTDTFIQNFVNVGRDLAVGIVSGLVSAEAQTAIGENTAKVIDIIASYLNSTLQKQKMNSSGEGYSETFTNGMVAKMAELFPTQGESAMLVSILSPLFDAMTNNVDKIVELGRYFSDGFAMGMTDESVEGRGMNAVRLAAQNLVTKTLETISAAGNIHSPSRETMRLGDFMAQGFANGMMNGVGLVSNASNTMTEAALSSAASMAETIQDLLENGCNPVITPVLDLSSVEAGSRSLSAMMGGYNLYGFNTNNQNSGVVVNLNATFYGYDESQGAELVRDLNRQLGRLYR